MPRVTLPIGLDLRPPVIEAALGELAPAALMAVPVAAVNEDDLSAAGEHNVGRSGQIPAVQTKAVAEPVQ